MSENVACRGPAPWCRETLTPGVVMRVGELPPPPYWVAEGGGWVEGCRGRISKQLNSAIEIKSYLNYIHSESNAVLLYLYFYGKMSNLFSFFFFF